MAYKDKQDPRYKASRMKWYYANKEKHLTTSREIGHLKKAYLNQLKNVPCKDCGKNYPSYVMEFHHKDIHAKKFTIGRNYREGWKRLQEEVNKCDVICANCHRIRSFKNMAH